MITRYTNKLFFISEILIVIVLVILLNPNSVGAATVTGDCGSGNSITANLSRTPDDKQVKVDISASLPAGEYTVIVCYDSIPDCVPVYDSLGTGYKTPGDLSNYSITLPESGSNVNYNYRVQLKKRSIWGTPEPYCSTSAALVPTTDPCIPGACPTNYSCIKDPNQPNGYQCLAPNPCAENDCASGYKCEATGVNDGDYKCVPESSTDDGSGTTGGGTTTVPVPNGMAVAQKSVEWLYRFILPIAIVIVIIKVIIHIYEIATSQGDPQKLGEAKENIYAT